MTSLACNAMVELGRSREKRYSSFEVGWIRVASILVHLSADELLLNKEIKRHYLQYDRDFFTCEALHR